MNRVGFIGSRDLNKVPQSALEMYVRAAELCVTREYILCTGAAVGADQLAAESCLNAGGCVELYLPWATYEQQWVGSMRSKFGERVRVTNKLSEDSFNSVSLHPSAQSLSQGVVKLMARNYMIVYRCKSVIAIPRPPASGGTAQGMKIATHLRIPLFNLSISEGRDRFAPLLSRV